MGFLVTSAIFFFAGFIACMFSLLCCNRGASTNMERRQMSWDDLHRLEQYRIQGIPIASLPLANILLQLQNHGTIESVNQGMKIKKKKRSILKKISRRRKDQSCCS